MGSQKKRRFTAKRVLAKVLLVAMMMGVLGTTASANENSMSKERDYLDWLEFDREIIDVAWESYRAYRDDVITSEVSTFYRPVIYVPVGTTVKLKSDKIDQKYRMTTGLDTVLTNDTVYDFVMNQSYNEVKITSTEKTMYGIYQYREINGGIYAYISGSRQCIARRYSVYIVGVDESALSGAEKFVDVKPANYFYTPVSWAVEHGITGGVSRIRFAPEDDCTVEQVLTFIWRAVGSPEPTISNPFADGGITESDYYYKAALWAYETGIETGAPSWRGPIFNGRYDCNRFMVAEYLWRLAGSPECSVTTVFSDVTEDDRFAQAVTWAVQQGITSGTDSNTFSPHRPCTRGEVMTFLYRYFVGS